VLVGDVNYWITGEDPALIPVDYFDEGAYATMLAFQEAKIEAHLARHDDIYLPFIFPWYGTGVVPSALGCEILFQPKEEPAVAGAVVTEPVHVRRLVPPDPERDGLMPRVLRAIDHFVAHSPWPVSFTDNQGPLNIALNLVGLERLMLWMYDEPAAVHELMDFGTTVLIDWVKVQKARAGARAGASPTRSCSRRSSAASGSPTTTARSSRRRSTGSSWSPTTGASSPPSAAAPSTTVGAPATSWRTSPRPRAWWPSTTGPWAISPRSSRRSGSSGSGSS